MQHWDNLHIAKRANAIMKGNQVMASDYEAAGVTVGHNLYIMRSITEDLMKGFYCDPNEHRHISASKDDLATITGALATMLDEIAAADTSRPVPRYTTPVFP